MAADPIEQVIRNLIAMQQVGTGVTKEARQLLQVLFRDIAKEIVDLDPTAPKQESYQRLRLQRLLGEVDSLIGKKFREVHKVVRLRLAEVGAAEAEWAAGLLAGSIGSVAVDINRAGVGVNMMKSILDAEPFQGALLKEWSQATGAATVRRVHTQIRLGMAKGETLDQMIRRVRGRSDGRGGFIGGVWDSTLKDTESVVRTAVNFISNRAHVETFQQNADILKELVVTATLDGKTSDICISLDGRTTSAEEPDPSLIPPFHFRCRTVLVPVVDWEGLGVEPPADGMRASKDGPVPSSQSYEDWLRTQPPSFQDEVLGPARAQLFREGKLSLRDLVTGDRRAISVEDLRKKAGVPKGPPPRKTPRVTPAAEIGKRLEAIDAPARAREAALFTQREALMAQYSANQDEYVRVLNEHGPAHPRLREIDEESRAMISKSAAIIIERDRIMQSRRAQVRKVIARPPAERTTVIVANSLKDGRALMDAGEAQFREMVHARWLSGSRIDVHRGPSRSFATYNGPIDNPTGFEVHLAPGVTSEVTVHELAHTLEFRHPEIRKASQEFRARRTKGEQLQSLKALTGMAYRPHEVTLPDKFRNPYVGRVYSGPAAVGTEIISMGLEYMAEDAAAFWREDPDHFEFIWMLMNGELPDER